jgi:predicted nicotinamide N-methyase
MTVTERIDLGGSELVIERPPSAEALLSEEAFEREEYLPYWAELWPSGIALARHVLAMPLGGCRVLELGCGLALPSIAAALAGANVLATDWSTDALAFAGQNANRNGARLTTALLRWDEPHILAFGTFDIVLAADVLYEGRNGEQLRRLLPRVVAPGGHALVADPARPHAERFLEAAAADWTVETIETPLLPRGGIHRLRLS